MFICFLSLYCKWFTCGNTAPQKVNFQDKKSQSGKTELGPLLLGGGFGKMALFVLFNVIPLSVREDPNAALQTSMWLSMASQLF